MPSETVSKVKRETLLQILGFVSVGLGKQGFGNCFIFRNGYVMAYNEDVVAKAPVPFKWTGAVTAPEFLGVLSKWHSKIVEMIHTPDALFVYSGKHDRVKLVLEDATDAEEFDHAFGTDWKPVPSGFVDALHAVEEAAATGSDLEESFTRCIHITPTHIEATDLSQFARCKIKSPVGGSVLILRETVKALMHLGVSEMCETETLICFRNEIGVTIGIVKQNDEFPDASHLLADVQEFKEYTLPGGLLDAISASEYFAAGEDRKQINVVIAGDQIQLSTLHPLVGECISEKPMKDYDGPDLYFVCEAKLLRRIAEFGRVRIGPLPTAGVDSNGDPRLLYRLIVKDRGFVFMVTTMEPDDIEPDVGGEDDEDDDGDDE